MGDRLRLTLLEQEHDLLGHQHERQAEKHVLLADAGQGARGEAADVVRDAEGGGVLCVPDVGLVAGGVERDGHGCVGGAPPGEDEGAREAGELRSEIICIRPGIPAYNGPPQSRVPLAEIPLKSGLPRETVLRPPRAHRAKAGGS